MSSAGPEFPRVVLYSDHYVGPEDNSAYIAYNWEDVDRIVRQIITQYRDFDEEAADRLLALESPRAIIRALGPDLNFFGGRIILKPTEPTP